MSALFLSNIDIMVACGSVILAVLVGGGDISVIRVLSAVFKHQCVITGVSTKSCCFVICFVRLCVTVQVIV